MASNLVVTKGKYHIPQTGTRRAIGTVTAAMLESAQKM